MSFELEEIRVISLLEPKEGEIYPEPIRDVMDDGEIENIYNIIERKEDCANPTANDEISCHNICLFDT